jgi:hypothetical protein
MILFSTISRWRAAMKQALLAMGAVAALYVGMSCDASARAADTGSARAACKAMGLNPSEAPFVYCVQSLAQSGGPRIYAMNRPPTASDADSYYHNSTTGYGAENACAAIGLAPTTAQFSYCVSNLNQTLFDQQNFLTR